jgi:hypothetical protein
LKKGSYKTQPAPLHPEHEISDPSGHRATVALCVDFLRCQSSDAMEVPHQSDATDPLRGHLSTRPEVLFQLLWRASPGPQRLRGGMVPNVRRHALAPAHIMVSIHPVTEFAPSETAALRDFNPAYACRTSILNIRMASNGFRPALLFLSSSGVSTTASIAARESSPTARGDRWLRADRPSLIRLASAYRHRKIPADPSSPLRIKISRIRFAQVERSSYFSRCPEFCGISAFGNPESGKEKWREWKHVPR